MPTSVFQTLTKIVKKKSYPGKSSAVAGPSGTKTATTSEAQLAPATTTADSSSITM